MVVVDDVYFWISDDAVHRPPITIVRVSSSM
jgi:hypothetical protein